MRKFIPYLFIAPLLIHMAIFIYGPILASLYLSFHEWNFMSDLTYVGFDNYTSLLSSSEFSHSLMITLQFVLVSVPIRLLAALGIASLLTKENKVQRWLRGAIFLPHVTSTVAISVVFSWIFATDSGLINSILTFLNMTRLEWLQDPAYAFLVIIIVISWKQLGYDVVIYVAAIQAIPGDLYEAAKIDGASKWQLFKRITFPLVTPTSFFLLIISVVDSFQMFTLIDVMTQGGPANSTDVLAHMLYRISFELFDIGQGSALAVVIFVVLVVLALFKTHVLSKKVHYVS